MAEFDVKPQQLVPQVNNLASHQRELEYIKESVFSISNSLSFKISSSAAIRARLQNCANKTGDHSKSMSGMSQKLETITYKYINTERGICGEANVGPANTSISGHSAGGTGGLGEAAGATATQINNSGPDWGDLGWDLLGSFGPVGAFISAVGGNVSGSWAESLVGAFKDGIDVGDQLGDAILTADGKISVDWKKMFGLNSEALDAAKAAKDTLTSPVKWVTAAIERGYQNITEYQSGDIDALRAVRETITETALTVGETALVTAGVTAVAAALGVTAAPVVVVGAITAGVVWGIDALCEHFTGKDAVELVSDGILDAAEFVEEKVNEAVGKAATAVKEKAKEVGNTIKEGVSTAWNSLCSLFG